MPEAFDAIQPALNLNPGFPTVVMGWTLTLPAGTENPGGFDVDWYEKLAKVLSSIPQENPEPR
jgi:hypothetical protein